MLNLDEVSSKSFFEIFWTVYAIDLSEQCIHNIEIGMKNVQTTG